ncbi:hypothetical protein BLA29_003255 [Euroglyphus maynei]|uniref:WH1 domain-containing protein n=1 Tax=Euroglyphus maynei TaxID=6958 RepID=A0A1Y3BU18_EURMA|nr:hypothetical protein BLA29_003255 [Euroglyphus maynei]
MTVENTKVGESPIFTTKAHVFHIDPQTKRSWIPASSAASVINSTIIPNMTFTKTSQKFGQWSDIRANTVYGLGFSSEPELNRFIEKFQEVKEATRIAQQKALQPNGNISNIGAAAAANHSLSARDSPRLSSAEYQNDILMSKSLLPHQRSQSLSGLQAKELQNF